MRNGVCAWVSLDGVTTDVSRFPKTVVEPRARAKKKLKQTNKQTNKNKKNEQTKKNSCRLTVKIP